MAHGCASSLGAGHAVHGGQRIEPPHPEDVPSTWLGRARLTLTESQPEATLQGTTIIIWHLPEHFDVSRVLQVWPIDGTFNYLEVPFSASEQCHKGRAIICTPGRGKWCTTLSMFPWRFVGRACRV
mmetsp:Transcript_843/g.2296  ORF Transcript_843/g.2296 Transcript_843/m.2296 type:complete len:126 (+) Transcript_843:53-430(+)